MNNLQKILKLMSKKHPTNYRKGLNPALLIYDDESGRIVKNASEHPFSENNSLFDFRDIQELEEYLEES